MNFSPSRAVARRLSVVNSIVSFFIALPFYLIVPHDPLTTRQIVAWWAAQVPFLIFVGDAFVVLWLARKVERVFTFDPLRETFVYGTSWKSMREMAAKTANIERDIATIEEMMPELRDDRAYAAAMSTRDFRKALSIAERSTQKREAEEKKNDRKKKRQTLAQAAREKIQQEARKLLIPESVLNRLQNPELQHAIEIVERSLKADYSSLVLDCFSRGSGVSEAESALNRAITLGKRAQFLEAPKEIWALIKSGALDKAQAELNACEEMQTRAKIESALRIEIEKIEDTSFRDDLLGELEMLSKVGFNSREYRKLRHSIENTLQACVD